MARKKPVRSEFPRGLLGNRKFQLAMEAYNKATNPPKPRPTSPTKRPNRYERRSGKGLTIEKPAKRGMSNIPKSEGTGGAAEQALGYGAGKPKGNGGSSRKPKPKPTKSATHTYAKHGSKLHIGRHKTLAEHRAAVAARKAEEEKKKKKNQGISARNNAPRASGNIA